MAIGNLEQNLAVNPFGKQVEIDKKPESVQKVHTATTIDKKIIKCISQLGELNTFLFMYDSRFKSLDVEALNPTQIEILLHNLIKKKSDLALEGNLIAGAYLTRIIQKSYDSGYNNFTLTIQDNKIPCLGRKLEGDGKTPLSLTVIGNAGISFMEEAINVNLTFYGHAEAMFFYKAQNCACTVYQDFGSRIGERSPDCRFKTTDKTIYDKLIDRIRSKSYSVQLIGANGEIVEEEKRL